MFEVGAVRDGDAGPRGEPCPQERGLQDGRAWTRGPRSRPGEGRGGQRDLAPRGRLYVRPAWSHGTIQPACPRGVHRRNYAAGTQPEGGTSVSARNSSAALTRLLTSSA